MSNEISLGIRIKQARIGKGLNQSELADKLSISQAAVSMFEKDQRQPTPKMIDHICELLDIEKKDLVGEEEESIEKNALMRNLKGLTPEEIRRINQFADFLKTYK